MQEKLSIKGNIIKYDIKTINKNINEILSLRFTETIEKKSISDLYDPYLLNDMEKAVLRIKKALKNKERIIIFGDYDVDGVTSTALVFHFLKKIGFDVSYRLPNRINDGYGLKNYFIDEIKSVGVSLIITVDCGTRDRDIVKYAASLGIDVIITDHHSVPEIIPLEAVALINPKVKDSKYPFQEICGAGVALKLIMALGKEFLSDEEYNDYIEKCIDIAALGTVSDCMPLIDENRLIVSLGLKQIKNSRSIGLRKLIQDKIGQDFDSDLFSFYIGPMLNSPGRLDTPYKSLSLLLNNGSNIDNIINEVTLLNQKRKELTHIYYFDALEKIDSNNNIIFYENQDIPHGIIGIIAGKLTEKFFKPSIVLKIEDNKLVGSCRSPSYFSIVEYLEKYKDYFISFGGHKQAAGFSISIEKFEEFKNKFLKEINSLDFTSYKKTITVDKVLDIKDFSIGLFNDFNNYKPFGIGNSKPIFMFQDFKIDNIKYLGDKMEHIKINNEYGIEVLGFGFGDYYDSLRKEKNIDLIVDIFLDNWNGRNILKVKIIDICI